MTGEVLNEIALGQLPMLQIIRRTAHKSEFGGVRSHRTNALLVISQREGGFARHKVPAAYGGVVRAGDDLGVDCLRKHTRYGVGVARESVNHGFRAYVPHARSRVATSGD